MSLRKYIAVGPNELIVVLFVIAILAYWLSVMFAAPPKAAKVAEAKVEMRDISLAISSYITAYGRFPIVSHTASGSNDFTFGTFGTSAADLGITNANGRQANNSEVMAILMDLQKFPNGSDTPNINHSLNPQRIRFLEANFAQSTNLLGIGPDGVYRDPWGHPYIITVNFKADGRCRDAFYRLASVSETNSGRNGLNGLIRPNSPPYTNGAQRDSFELVTNVMIWSLGPDGKADLKQKADQGVNKDNILSW